MKKERKKGKKEGRAEKERKKGRISVHSFNCLLTEQLPFTYIFLLFLDLLTAIDLSK
jgi:hypothetical protein